MFPWVALCGCGCCIGTAGLLLLIKTVSVVLPPLVAMPQRLPTHWMPIDAHYRIDVQWPAKAEPQALLYRDLEEEPRLYERLALARARDRELVLLTSDVSQLPLTLNLIANLHELGMSHHLLLARDRNVCRKLKARGEVACVWSSYLLSRRPSAVTGKPPRATAIEKLWLQRHHYMGRGIGAGLNMLLLDSDVVIARDPYPYLKGGVLGRFNAIVLGDSTLSASPTNLNGGVWYVQNASRDGPLRALFRRFDAHVDHVFTHGAQGDSAALFDQTILNEQALEGLHRDQTWRRTQDQDLRLSPLFSPLVALTSRWFEPHREEAGGTSEHGSTGSTCSIKRHLFSPHFGHRCSGAGAAATRRQPPCRILVAATRRPTACAGSSYRQAQKVTAAQPWRLAVPKLAPRSVLTPRIRVRGRIRVRERRRPRPSPRHPRGSFPQSPTSHRPLCHTSSSVAFESMRVAGVAARPRGCSRTLSARRGLEAKGVSRRCVRGGTGGLAPSAVSCLPTLGGRAPCGWAWWAWRGL